MSYDPSERLSHYEGEPWDQQPTESADMYARFTAYASMAPGERRYAAIAADYAVTVGAIEAAAKKFRWRDRAALQDAHERRRRRDAIADKELQLAERNANLALVSAGILARSLRHIGDSGVNLDPKDMPAWAKMVETFRRMAVDAPDQVIELTGKDGGPIRVEEFAGLTDEQARDRMSEMARSVLRVVDGGRAS